MVLTSGLKNHGAIKLFLAIESKVQKREIPFYLGSHLFKHAGWFLVDVDALLKNLYMFYGLLVAM